MSSQCRLRIELIVVDDCSTDGTREHLPSCSASYGFTLLLQERNQGKGAALRRGFAAVTGDIVVDPGRRPRVLARGATRSSSS